MRARPKQASYSGYAPSQKISQKLSKQEEDYWGGDVDDSHPDYGSNSPRGGIGQPIPKRDPKRILKSERVKKAPVHKKPDRGVGRNKGGEEDGKVKMFLDLNSIPDELPASPTRAPIWSRVESQTQNQNIDNNSNRWASPGESSPKPAPVVATRRVLPPQRTDGGYNRSMPRIVPTLPAMRPMQLSRGQDAQELKGYDGYDDYEYPSPRQPMAKSNLSADGSGTRSGHSSLSPRSARSDHQRISPRVLHELSPQRGSQPPPQYTYVDEAENDDWNEEEFDEYENDDDAFWEGDDIRQDRAPKYSPPDSACSYTATPPNKFRPSKKKQSTNVSRKKTVSPNPSRASGSTLASTHRPTRPLKQTKVPPPLPAEGSSQCETSNKVLTEKEKLYYSRAPRDVTFKPMTVTEYRATKPSRYVEIDRLKPDLNSEELKAKRANANRVKEFSKNLQQYNKQSILNQRKIPSGNEVAQIKVSKQKMESKLERMKAFARDKIPKPKQRETYKKEDFEHGYMTAADEFGMSHEEATNLQELEVKHKESQAQVEAIKRSLGMTRI